MSEVEWGEYKIGDLFEKLNLSFKKKTFDKKNDISTEKTDEFCLPLVNAKDGNNGIMYFGRPEDFESAELTLDIVNDGAISTGNVYAQPQRTGVLYNAYLIKPLFKTSPNLLHFFACTIQKSIKHKYGYENKAGWEKVKKEIIQLPTKDGKIDFDFMESFVAELEAERVAELEAERVAELSAYLTVSGYDNYELSTEEQKAIDEYDRLDWGVYQIKEIFDIHSYKKRFDANKVTITENIGHPYIVRTGNNNGCRGYIDEDEQFLNEGNTISFGQDTATMYYQEKPYFTGDKIKIMHSKIEGFGKSNAQFFLTAMNKAFSSYSWGASRFNVESLQKETINLPIKDHKIDIPTMNLLISAIQKLVIKDVVLYSDKKIAATKAVVSPATKQVNDN